LPRAIAGDLIVSLGMSEPEAGSALTDLTTTATPDGDGVRLNGTKVFGTHSAEADIYLIYCRYGPGVGGIGSVIVEPRAGGLHHRHPHALPGRRDMVPALFRGLPCAGRADRPAGGRLQEANGRLQRRAHRQHGALAGRRAACLQPGRRACAHATAVRAAAL